MEIIVEAQGSLLKVSQKIHLPYRERKTSARRGKIKGFSQKSRIRLLQLVARLRIIRKLHPTFLTLTYGKKFPDCPTAKKHLWNFIKRLRRRSPKVFSCIWRLELQDRNAPHFHLIIFNMPFMDKTTIQELWAECVSEEYWDYSSGQVRYPFTRIEGIRSHRKLFSYVSKYIAKKDDVSPEGDASSSSGFNNAPYLADENIGRLWGVINRAMLPFDKLSRIIVKYGRSWYKEFQDMCRQVWNGLEDDSGFHLYVSDPYTIPIILKAYFIKKLGLPLLSELNVPIKELPCEISLA